MIINATKKATLFLFTMLLTHSAMPSDMFSGLGTALYFPKKENLQKVVGAGVALSTALIGYMIKDGDKGVSAIAGLCLTPAVVLSGGYWYFNNRTAEKRSQKLMDCVSGVTTSHPALDRMVCDEKQKTYSLQGNILDHYSPDSQISLLPLMVAVRTLSQAKKDLQEKYNVAFGDLNEAQKKNPEIKNAIEAHTACLDKIQLLLNTCMQYPEYKVCVDTHTLEERNNVKRKTEFDNSQFFKKTIIPCLLPLLLGMLAPYMMMKFPEFMDRLPNLLNFS